MKKIIISLFLLINILIVLTTKADDSENNINQFKDLSIIIPSYDKYSELWEPMFTMLFKYWPNLNTMHKNIPIYLISNEEKFKHPRVTNILVGDIDKGWSSNFLKALEQIKTKYVIIILDDYIMNKPVNEKRLDEILKLMKKNNAAYTEIAIDTVLNDGPAVDGVNSVIIRDRFGYTRTSLQTCIWETEVLKWLLKPGESIWDFEDQGSIRSSGIMLPFYLVTKDPVFSYFNAAYKGKYLKDVIDYINNQGGKFNPTKLPINSTYKFRLNKDLPEENPSKSFFRQLIKSFTNQIQAIF